MATNHTTNYALNLWEPQDSFLRTEFNENSQKIDAAIKAEADARTALAQTVSRKAETSALNALTQTVAQKADAATVTAALNKKGNCRFITGNYVGDGTYEFTLPFGAPPTALFIVGGSLFFAGVRHEGLTYNATTSKTNEITATWEEDHLKIECRASDPAYRMNTSGKMYQYLAMFDTE